MPPDGISADLEWLTADPRAARIAIEREMVKRGGLKIFIRLAWHIIEPGTQYVPNWHIDAICDELDAVSCGENTRLLIGIPPRSMKSTIVAVMWPAFDWIEHPSRRFLYASYNVNLATRDNMRTRRIVESPWYRERWGDIFYIAKDQNTKTKFENSRTGSREVTSVGGQTTGLGADIAVLDDPNNVLQAESSATRETTLTWWNEAMPSRLNDQQTGAFVVVQQRVNEADVTGDILRRTPGLYRYICLPAEYDPQHPYRYDRDIRTEPGELLWPAKFTREAIERLKKALGSYAASSQLQQLPSPRSGGLFKAEWLIPLPTHEMPADIRWVRAWDIAASEKTIVKADPDYTATAKVGRSISTGKFYIGHVQRWRVEMHMVKQLMLQIAVADGSNVTISVPQDPGAAGKGLAQEFLSLLSAYPTFADRPTGDKVTRATAFAGQMGGGMMRMLVGDWNEEFVAELVGFPTGAHDDMIDAVSAAYGRLVQGETGLLDYYTAIAGDRKQPAPETGYGFTTGETSDMGVLTRS